MPHAEQQSSVLLGSKQTLGAWSDCCQMSPPTCQQLLCTDLSFTSSCPGMSQPCKVPALLRPACKAQASSPYFGLYGQSCPQLGTPHLHLSPVVGLEEQRNLGNKMGPAGLNLGYALFFLTVR